MCKFGGLLIAYDPTTKRALVTDADCGTWKCPECSARMRDSWVRRAQHGVVVFQKLQIYCYFATITSHEDNTTFAACARAFPDAWKKLHKRLNKTGSTHEYLLIPEKHADGRMHMHAVWTFPVKTRWLKDNGRECGFGFINQIGRRGHVDETIEDVAQVAGYVSKYLGKSLGGDVPKRFRKVRTSQGWPREEAVNAPFAGLTWEYIGTNGTLLTHYERCDRENYTMLDVRTGEIFEDVDLGTIVYA